MPTSTFIDPGTYNLRDMDQNLLVGKVHVEAAATDVAGGRGYLAHYAVVKANPDQGWGVYAKPNSGGDKTLKWVPTTETLAQFLNWVGDTNRRPNLRYVLTPVREQDVVP